MQFTRGNEKIAFSSVVELFPFVKNYDFPASTSTRCNEGIKLARNSAISSFHSKRCHVGINSQCKVNDFVIFFFTYLEKVQVYYKDYEKREDEKKRKEYKDKEMRLGKYRAVK